MGLALNDLAPDLLGELRVLLVAEGEHALAAQIDTIEIVDRCRCGDDFCATFYTQPLPRGVYGPTHRNVALNPREGMLILDIVDERIACVEVLYNESFRRRLLTAFP